MSASFATKSPSIEDMRRINGADLYRACRGQVELFPLLDKLTLEDMSQISAWEIEAWSRVCPRCGAPSSFRCLSPDSPRARMHPERFLFTAQPKPQPPLKRARHLLRRLLFGY